MTSDPERKEAVLVGIDAVRQAIEAVALELKLMPEFADMPKSYQLGYADAVEMIHNMVVKSLVAIQELP